MTRLRPLWLPLALLALTLLLLLAAGSLRLQQAALTRGIPEGLPPSIPHGGVRLGLNVYLESDTAESELRRLAATGVTSIRQPFYFTPEFNWEQTDRLVAAAVEQGLELVPLLDGDPATAFTPPADPAVFADWAGAFAGRYGELLTYYIIWDEPNLQSHWGGEEVNPAGYAALLSAAATAIRDADPDAVIVGAPLAPTRETGPDNLAAPLFLQALYEAGAGPAFDVAAGKAYGFDTGPEDRRIDLDVLNFSQIILLREVLVKNGDEHKAVWAGNWGWNSLPAGWQGNPSIWGQTDEETRIARTVAAVERARQEWPWMGLMFLENWKPDAGPDDARWGFSVAGRPLAERLSALVAPDNVAYPGFHPAAAQAPGQSYQGAWDFSPTYGADIPLNASVEDGTDRVTLDFWGTDVGVRVRHAEFRARFYATVDGQPANALPRDENGAMLVLTAPADDEDYLETQVVARDLEPGPHTLTLIAHRGWDQWALNGFTVAYHPPRASSLLAQALLLSAAFLSGLATILIAWHRRLLAPLLQRVRQWQQESTNRAQLLLTFAVALIVGLTGWLTWGAQAAGLYRRLDDPAQLALTATAATIFYVAPSFFVYLPALIALFLLLYARPAWGAALVAFSFPFYVTPKPLLGYRFSPSEIFVLVATAAWFVRWLTDWRPHAEKQQPTSWQDLVTFFRKRLVPADYAVAAFVAVATLSLFFTARLDVALNEWRVVIVEPALFYLLLRGVGLSQREGRVVLHAFLLGGVLLALYGLGSYALCQLGNPADEFCATAITMAGRVPRLRGALYGSPNNLALYLGRVFPLLASLFLLGKIDLRRRLLYGAALIPVALALLLSFSKGALFLGVPAALLVIVLFWQGRRAWPWLVGLVLLGGVALVAGFNIPLLAERLDLGGATSVFRLNLWQASLQMFADHPLFGVGLDNFLYQYRGRYIFESAWQEPNLNHPHNILLDFATRLGLLGIIAGGWLILTLLRLLWKLPNRVSPAWRPVAVGLCAIFADMMAHGLVDHSFFLSDLAYIFFLLLGMAVWMHYRLPEQAGTSPGT